MSDEFKTSLSYSLKSIQNRYMKGRLRYDCKIKEAHWLKCEDSVDDFITKHSTFITDICENGCSKTKMNRFVKKQNLVMTPDITKPVNCGISLSETCLHQDVKKRSKSTYCCPPYHFDKEKLMSEVIKNNMRLNTLVYTLVYEMLRDKQNRKLQRFVNASKKKRDDEIIQKVSKQTKTESLQSKLNDRTSSYQTWNIPDVTQLSMNKSSQLPCKHLGKEVKNEISYTNTGYTQRSKLICYQTSSDSRRTMQREKPTNKSYSTSTEGATKNNGENSSRVALRKCKRKEHVTFYQSHEDPLYLHHSKRSKQDITTSVTCKKYNEIQSEENLNQKAYTDKNFFFHTKFAFKIDQLMASINALIEEIKQQKFQEKAIVCGTKLGNKAASDFSIAMKEKFGIDNIKPFLQRYSEIKPLTNSNIKELCNTITDKKYFAKSIEEIRTNCSSTNMQQNPIFESMFKMVVMDRARKIYKCLGNLKLKYSKFTMTEASMKEMDRTLVEKISKEANTEPLSILTLIRISVEAIRQLLSYIPYIDYLHLSFPQLSYFSGNNESPCYTCNTCGAPFDKASLLNDHIKSHELGPVRCCRVCQHVLEMRRIYNQEPFKCQYCGQCFTRAYCCELHQQSCAERMGLKHDVSSNLILLQ